MDLTLQRHPVWRAAAMALLGFLALAAWAVSSPPGSSPDDDYHLTSIWCGQGERAGLCENVTNIAVDVPNNVVHAPCFAYDKGVTASCQTQLGTQMFSMGRANILEHSYPGGFYWTMSWFSGPDVTLSVMLMRLFNAALFVAIAGLTFGLIERRWRGPLGLGIAVTIVPLGMFIIPSTNPSSWTLYAPVFVFLLARTLLRTSHRASKIAISTATIAIAIIASSARSDAAIFAVFALGLAAVAERRTRFNRLAFYVSFAATVAVALWSLLVGRQTAAASGGLNGAANDSASASIGLLIRNVVDLPGLLVGSLGTWNLGWLDTPMPGTVWGGTVGVLSALIMTALCFKVRWREAIIPLLATIALVAVPVAVAQASSAPIGSYVQPRYVLPLLALAVGAILTTATSRILISRRQLDITLIVLVVANTVALGTNVIRYNVGLESVNFDDPTDLASSAVFLLMACLASGLLAALFRVAAQKSMYSERSNSAPWGGESEAIVHEHRRS